MLPPKSVWTILYFEFINQQRPYSHLMGQLHVDAKVFALRFKKPRRLPEAREFFPQLLH